MSKILLHGFNNLTKSLSFSLYKLHYIGNKDNYIEYNAYINTAYCADNLNVILTHICQAIGGNVLNIAMQDYQPQGASVTLMISEEAHPESLVAHIDKSHICIHTYPDESPCENIAIFRADIELSTCGVISPLKVINFIINEFDADVIDIDYRVRGMTRNTQGNKLFTDEKIESISHFVNSKIRNKYFCTDNNLANQNLFHTKLCQKEIDLTRHLFKADKIDLTENRRKSVTLQLKKEIEELTRNV